MMLRWLSVVLVGLVALVGLTPVSAQDTGADDRDLAWSPDGSQIAFVSNRTGLNEIYVMDAAGGEPRQLTQDAYVSGYPFWLPDGQTLIFNQYKRDERIAVFQVDVATGTTEKLFGDDTFSYDASYGVSPDKRWLLVGRGVMTQNKGRATQDLIFYDWVDHTMTEVAVGSEVGASSLDLFWSPDNTRIAMLIWDASDDGRYVYLYDVASGELTPNLIAEYDQPQPLINGFVWLPNGTHILLNFALDPKLYELNLATGTLTPISGMEGLRLYIQLPSGDIFYWLDQSAENDWMHLFKTTPDDPTPKFFTSVNSGYAVLAPDGRHLLIIGRFEIGENAPYLWQVFDLETGEQVTLTLPASIDSGRVSWSPDSRYLGIPLCADSDFDLYIIDIQTNESRNLTTEDVFTTSASSSCGMA